MTIQRASGLNCDADATLPRKPAISLNTSCAPSFPHTYSIATFARAWVPIEATYRWRRDLGVVVS